MKKKIVFGSIFSTFILLSLTFLTPVQASGTDILDEVSHISKKIAQDENLDAIKSDPDLIKLASMINVETREDNFKNEVESLINKILEKQEFIDFMDNHKEDIENFLQLLSEKYNNNLPEATRDVYYKIYTEEDRINIKKETNPDLDVEGIVVSSNDNLVTINGVSDGGFLQRLMDFLYWLSYALLFSGDLLVIIGTLITTKGDPFGDTSEVKLYRIGSALIGISGLLAIAGGCSYLLHEILESFVSITENSKKNKTTINIPTFKEKIVSILEYIMKCCQRILGLQELTIS